MAPGIPSGGAAAAGWGVMWFMGIMLVSGSLNTILMKFMTMQKVPTSPGADGEGFDQPYFQTLLMMIGEFLCLIAYYVNGRDQNLKFEEVPKSIFGVACLFDWIATTLVNMAYICIAASVVQMTRGAIVIFTCFLSVVFLGRRQYKYHIVGVSFVALGITLVSLSTFFNPSHGVETQTASAYTKIFGISLCLGAQVFQASMLVYEEKIMSKYTVPPLLVVGMEGSFGIAFGIVLLAVLNATRVENTAGAVYQITHSTPLLCAVIGSIFSIAFFNFSGVTVTQKASAVARSTIDVSRTIIIWAVELGMGWNHFNWLQLAGFVVLALGTMIYNRLLTFSFLETPESSPLLDSLKKAGELEKGMGKEGMGKDPDMIISNSPSDKIVNKASSL
jgi:drug/metabolite transporter (DMT)-like permease